MIANHMLLYGHFQEHNAMLLSFSLLSLQDTDTGKIYKFRTVFQVLIKPGSYSVGKETIGAGDQVIDSEFDNSEIEWSTKRYGSTVLYGLLIKAEE